MKIEQGSVLNYQNYSNAVINFAPSTLITGSNDADTTNLIFGIRLLLDKSLSDRDIEPAFY